MYGYDTFILQDNVDMSTALLSSTKLFGGFKFVMREKFRPVIQKKSYQSNMKNIKLNIFIYCQT